jgi:putative acetyltransferase
VVCHGDHILGGAGIAPLHDGPSGYCELQKMYFLPDARGKGLGNQMIQKCLTKAKSYGYTDCYLETMPNMIDAQKLYKKWGFTYIDHPSREIQVIAHARFGWLNPFEMTIKAISTEL